jgi:hypothetical protein
MFAVMTATWKNQLWARCSSSVALVAAAAANTNGKLHVSWIMRKQLSPEQGLKAKPRGILLGIHFAHECVRPRHLHIFVA